MLQLLRKLAEKTRNYLLGFRSPLHPNVFEAVAVDGRRAGGFALHLDERGVEILGVVMRTT